MPELNPGGPREAPTNLRGMIRYLGPGMIIAAGVVGCVIKVFTQIELGRYAVSTNETTLTAINRIPGPRWRANWTIWLWCTSSEPFGQKGSGFKRLSRSSGFLQATLF